MPFRGSRLLQRFSDAPHGNSRGIRTLLNLHTRLHDQLNLIWRELAKATNHIFGKCVDLNKNTQPLV
jgi:hypothetical protein